jgi:hypothetical protein
MTRDFTDVDGRPWHALAVDTRVAHAKKGARLAFRPADTPDAEPLETPITFNSYAAADFALRTLGVKELRRRLSLTLGELVGP